MAGQLKEIKMYKSLICKHRPRKCWTEGLLKDEHSLGDLYIYLMHSSLQAATHIIT